jgi:TRAP-type C4-dicarboxylate transport system substrate-binding protein
MLKKIIKPALFFGFTLLALTANAGVIKIATLSPDGSVWMKKMRAGGDVIEQRTAGRVKFKFYPGGVMGDDSAVLRKMRINQLQGGAITSGALETIYPDSQIYNMPLLFKSFDEVDYVRKHMDKTLEQGFEAKNFVTFGFAEGGLAYPMTKGSPIQKPSDLQNHKIWAPTADTLSALTFASINVTPIPLSLGDVLAGLQTNLIDTLACPPIPAVVMQWHSQMTSVTDIPMTYVYAMLAIDKKVFNGLSAADQVVVREEMRKVFVELDQQNRKDNINAFDALKKQGIVVITPSEADRKAWYELGDQAQKKLLAQKLVSKETYKQAEDLLRAYRSDKTVDNKKIKK